MNFDKKKNISEALIMLNKGLTDRAELLLNELLSINNKDFDVLYLKGLVCGIDGRHAECKAYLLRAEKINKNHPYLQYNLANALDEVGSNKEAIEHHEIASKLMPLNPDVWINFGKSLYKLQSLNRALECFKRAIQLKPDYTLAYINIVAILNELENYKESLSYINKAIEFNNNESDLYNKRGTLNSKLLRYEESILDYDRSITLNPLNAEAYNNKANVQKELKQYNEAIKNYTKAIEISPEYPEAFVNFGLLYQELGDYDRAIFHYKRAMLLRHDFSEAHWSFALCNLLIGNFELGWEHYEWGWKNGERGKQRNFKEPLWLGQESLRNKSILVYAEQGVGDIIQFCRYLKVLKKMECNVIFEVPKKLITLLKTLDGIDEIFETNMVESRFDYQCPLISLPLALGTKFDSIPKYEKYIEPNKSEVNHIKAEFDKILDNKKIKIGISWNSQAKKTGKNRSIKLKNLISKFRNKNIQYINLQYGDYAEEIAEVKEKYETEIYTSKIDIFNDMNALAVLIDNCDIIISIDNVTAHLSGAMGKDTRVLLPRVADWRWHLDDKNSAWYSSVKLYRQIIDGDWNVVLEDILKDIEIKYKLKTKFIYN
jgi:tetratricopeptide (TPR) repeat protein/ADP-heptose:LPS heptosyltransferase